MKKAFLQLQVVLLMFWLLEKIILLENILSEETVKNVTLADVQTNYATYFVPENAYLVIIGDVKFKETKAAVEKLFGGWKKQTAPKSTYPNPENVSKLQIDFVDVPNAVQSEISLVNTVNLKMSDPDFFPAVIANQILGGDFNSYLNMNLREATRLDLWCEFKHWKRKICN